MNILVARIDERSDDVARGAPHVGDAELVRATLPTVGHAVTDDPNSADLILLFEYNGFKTQRFVPILQSHPLVADYPDKCFTVNFDDAPVGFLPGLYVSMPRARFDVRRARAITYCGEYNTHVADGARRREDVIPSILYSFRGSTSHPIRERILALPPRRDARLYRSFGWFDHSPDVQRSYVNELLESQFVLCPRGLGTTTVRLFETMQLGRVPVVISDQWVPPEGPDWSRIAVVLPEAAIADIPRQLEAIKTRAAEMGRAARDAWERWFSPAARVAHAVRLATELQTARPPDHDERAIQRSWSGWSFWYRHGWTLPQRVRRRAVREVRQRLIEPLRPKRDLTPTASG